MWGLYVLITLSLSPFFSTPALASPQYQAPITSTAAISSTFRNATLEDIDDITTVYVDAFSKAPVWSYIRQFADIYPEYTWTCQRDALKKAYLNYTAAGSAILKVISVPDQSLSRKERVVSFSAWELSRIHQASAAAPPSFSSASLAAGSLMRKTLESAEGARADGFDCAARLELNMTRAQHYWDKMREAVEETLLKPYARQLSLGLLATHPDWDGNGFAARHLHWGKEMLVELNRSPEYREQRLPLTLVGTPAGYPLYISEGFKGLANITIERLDGKGIIWDEAMKYEEAELDGFAHYL